MDANDEEHWPEQPVDVPGFLRALKGTRVEDAQNKGRAAGYRVVTFGPNDSTTISAELDLRRLVLNHDSEGIVGSASTG